MIDNIELIKPLLKFETDDDFYYLQILQRKKENKLLNANARVVKEYYIPSIDYLDYYYEEIKLLCNIRNARAMLRLNKRSWEKTAFHTLLKNTNQIMNKDFKSCRKSWSRACGMVHNAGNSKTWIIDIDSTEMSWIEEIKTSIENSAPNNIFGESKIKANIPSKSGIHLITRSFNTVEFDMNFRAILERYSLNKGDVSVEIHKDNPTNLYIP